MFPTTQQLTGQLPDAPAPPNVPDMPPPQIPGGGAPAPPPQPEMPNLQAPPAPMPSLGAAQPMPPAPPSQMDLLRQQLAESQKRLQAGLEQAEQEAAQHRAFLQQAMSTKGLEGYLPKPSATQMLSDALTNFGMVRLTGGQGFEPIQVKRYREAYQAHSAHVQDVTAAQAGANATAQQFGSLLNQQRQMELAAEKLQNDEAKQAQAQAETARKTATSEAALGLKKQIHTDAIPLNAAKEDEARAKASQAAAAARLLQSGGGNVSNALANYAEVNRLDLGDPSDFKEYLDVAERLRNATRFKPEGGGVTERIVPDKNGDMVMIAGPKGGAKTVTSIALPNGYGNFSPASKNNLTQLATAESLARDVQAMLESTKTADGKPLKDVGKGNLFDALGAGAKERAAYVAYVSGIGNDANPLSILKNSPNTGNESLDKLIQYSAMLKIIGAQPYLHGIRNMNYVSQIQVHLPNEKADTPAMMYKKITSLLPQWDRMRQEVVDYETHPLDASRQDSKSTKTPPRGTPDTPKTPPKPKAGIITDPKDVRF